MIASEAVTEHDIPLVPFAVNIAPKLWLTETEGLAAGEQSFETGLA